MQSFSDPLGMRAQSYVILVFLVSVAGLAAMWWILDPAQSQLHAVTANQSNATGFEKGVSYANQMWEYALTGLLVVMGLWVIVAPGRRTGGER